MIIKEFRELPNIEGFTIGSLRIDPEGMEVVGYVLKDREGIKRYILLFGKDLKIEPYW